MAVAAVNSIVPDVMFMAELDRLFADLILSGVIRGARRPQDCRQAKRRHYNHQQQTDAGYGVGTAVKNLGHVKFSRELRNAQIGNRPGFR
jgi:hypothetical protein